MNHFSYSEKAKENMVKRINELRTEKFTSKTAFAAAVGCSYQTVTNWEKGERLPDTDMLFKICDVCGCDMDYLTGRIEAHTNAADDIIKVIGLSENSVKLLIAYNKFAHDPLNTVQHDNTPFNRKILSNQDMIEHDGDTMRYDIAKIQECNTDYLAVISQVIETDLTASIYKYLHTDLENRGLTEPYNIKPGDIFSRIVLDRIKQLLDEIKLLGIISTNKKEIY